MAVGSAQDSEYKQRVIPRANGWDINTPRPVAGNQKVLSTDHWQGKLLCSDQTNIIYVYHGGSPGTFPTERGEWEVGK